MTRRTYDRTRIETALSMAEPGRWQEIDRGPSNYMQALASRWRGAPRGPYTYQARSAGHGSGISILYGMRTRAVE